MPHATASTKSSSVELTGKQVELEGTRTVLLVGVGGQGTILTGNILAMTAAEADPRREDLRDSRHEPKRRLRLHGHPRGKPCGLDGQIQAALMQSMLSRQ